MTAKRLAPIHPGQILLEEFMEPLNLSRNKLAKALGVTPKTINEIVNRKRGITGNVALRLSRYFGTTPGVWMNLQKRYELETAKDKYEAEIAKIEACQRAVCAVPA
jgi:antitoxin HigA-1